MTHQQIEVRPITASMGAEIFGVDLSQPLSDTEFEPIHQALLEHIFIAFRDQTLDPEQFAQFGERFGELEHETFIPELEGYGDRHLHKFRGHEADQTQDLGWHVDHSYRTKPSMGAGLYCIDVPDAGADTLFANMYDAYDTLSDSMKVIIEDMRGVHDVLHYSMQLEAFFPLDKPKTFGVLGKMREHLPRVTHPLVCTHPETGRKFLYVNPRWMIGIEGLAKEESRGILNVLFEHAVQPRFQCRFRWQNGTLGMWDNRCVVHSGVPDYMGKWYMWRYAVGGTWEPE